MDRLIFAVHLLESRAAVKLQKLESIIATVHYKNSFLQEQ